MKGPACQLIGSQLTFSSETKKITEGAFKRGGQRALLYLRTIKSIFIYVLIVVSLYVRILENNIPKSRCEKMNRSPKKILYVQKWFGNRKQDAADHSGDV